MGVVYRARDRESGRTVALKALHGADPDDLYRLKNEFRALAGVVHPHLVRLYEMSVEGDRGFFTMELVEGARTLVEHLRSAGRAGGGAARGLPSARERARLPARGRLDPPRPQAFERAGGREAGRVVLLDFGLIRGLGAEQRGAHAGRRRRRHARLHVAGAGARPAAQRGLGLVQLRRPALRVPDRALAVRGRAGRGAARPRALLDSAARRWSRPDCAPDLARAGAARSWRPIPCARPDASRVLAVLADGGAPAASRADARAARPSSVARASWRSCARPGPRCARAPQRSRRSRARPASARARSLERFVARPPRAGRARAARALLSARARALRGARRGRGRPEPLPLVALARAARRTAAARHARAAPRVPGARARVAAGAAGAARRRRRRAARAAAARLRGAARAARPARRPPAARDLDRRPAVGRRRQRPAAARAAAPARSAADPLAALLPQRRIAAAARCSRTSTSCSRRCRRTPPHDRARAAEPRRERRAGGLLVEFAARAARRRRSLAREAHGSPFLLTELLEQDAADAHAAQAPTSTA